MSSAANLCSPMASNIATIVWLGMAAILSVVSTKGYKRASTFAMRGADKIPRRRWS